MNHEVKGSLSLRSWFLPYLFVSVGLAVGSFYPFNQLEALLAVIGVLAGYAALFMPRKWVNGAYVAGAVGLLWLFSSVATDPIVLTCLLFFPILATYDGEQTPIKALFVGCLAYFLLAETGLLWVWDDHVGRRLVVGVLSLVKGSDPISLFMLLGAWPVVAFTSMFRAGDAGKRWPLLLGIVARRLVVVAAFVVIAILFKHHWPFLVLIAYALWTRPEALESEEEEEEVRPTARPYWVAASLAGAILYGFGVFGTFSDKPRSVAFTEIGLGVSTPDRGIPDSPNMAYSANFGQLFDYLKGQGVQTKILPKNWTAKDLDGVDAVFAINPTVVPSEAQVAAIYERVQGGMNLVVSGDHTDIRGVMKPCNAFLGRVPIKLKFDSATPVPSHDSWHKGLWVHPTLRQVVRTTPELNISVGASLAIGAPAQALVVGIHGYSDKADLKNAPGYVGDLTYSPDEPLGSLVLAAETGLGNGRVVAFGDTSSFQDDSIAYTNKLILSVLGSPSLTAKYLPILLIGGALLILVGLVPAAENRFGNLVGVGVVGIAFMAIGYLTNDRATPVVYGPAIVYDTSSFSNYPGEFSDERLNKLTWLHTRQGRQLIFGPADKAIQDRAQGIIVAAPLVEVPPAKVNALKGYVEQGGSLIVFTGHKHYENTAGLLNAFGLSIDPTPLGGHEATLIADPDLQKRLTMPQERALTFAGKWEYLVDACEVKGDGKVLTTTFNHPTSRLKRVGKGTVLVVGDSRILTDRGLGERLEVNVGGSRLLYELINLSQTAR